MWSHPKQSNRRVRDEAAFGPLAGRQRRIVTVNSSTKLRKISPASRTFRQQMSAWISRKPPKRKTAAVIPREPTKSSSRRNHAGADRCFRASRGIEVGAHTVEGRGAPTVPLRPLGVGQPAARLRRGFVIGMLLASSRNWNCGDADCDFHAMSVLMCFLPYVSVS